MLAAPKILLVELWTTLTREFKEIKLQNVCNDRHLVLLQNLGGDHFAIVDSTPQMVRHGQRNIMQPDSATGLITLEIRVV